MKSLKWLIENSEQCNIDLNKFEDINPRQIVNNSNLSVVLYRVDYSYTTIRGNPKQGEKYFMLNGINPQMDMRKELDRYINDFNVKNPNRKLLNVKFLNSECLGYLVL